MQAEGSDGWPSVSGREENKACRFDGEMFSAPRERARSSTLISISSVLASVILLAVCALQVAGQSQTTTARGATAQGVAATGTPTPAGRPKKPDPAAVERGKTLFASNCSFCHGANAKGGEGGPDLIRSLVVLDDENGESIGAVVLNGRVDRGMPKFALSTDQIRDLVTFLHNQIQATAAFNSYQILNIVVGDAKAGEAYFNGAGKCSTCHSATGDLAHIGSKFAPADLQQKFIMPRGEGGFRVRSQSERAAIQAKVTLPSGEIVEGHVIAIDDFKLTVIDAKGERRTFSRDGDTPHVELNDPLREHAALLRKYTDTDIHNLTAYLVTLK
jgi:cytochrome c oxidase cbb3-type subunit 3